MSIIKVNGINLNVEVQGYGQPLILIHGLGCDNTQWEREIKRLSKNFKTIALDCRGHGKSDKPTSYTLNDHIQDILSIMDTFEFSTVNLYGVSMGSYIAQGVAISQPNRVKKLILTVPKSNGLTSSTQRLIQEHEDELKKLDELEKLKFFYKFISYNPDDIFSKYPNILSSTLTPEQTSAANKALAGFDFRNKLHYIKAKTLVISGKYDCLNPPSEGKLCASLIPNATFIEMQYSGHIPMIEEPEKYIKIIEKFLSK
ncbi:MULTISPECIES: alpha/beta hydrolase [unclassified Clostridium]|uniref:alpha/beta fold hydrolase n=1 Tax=unclassified Clostridium TaxID=2614128 RepID=UPI0002973F95|nr:MULTISPECIES: alpha/beta hydrolase [unclassified Clostridium]EKQ57701.1 MAG: putative hydrolase or acyltransferase of alpha/beta superfamily [Clostridium sp. Maddingley MBC34-26]